MSSTQQVATFSDLYTALEQAVRVTTGVTTTQTQSKRAINMALHDMHLGLDYRLPWAERRAVLRTQDDYTTGTVTTTKGSTAVTGASTLWNTANDFSVNNVRAGGKIVFGGSRTPYRMLSGSRWPHAGQQSERVKLPSLPAVRGRPSNARST